MDCFKPNPVLPDGRKQHRQQGGAVGTAGQPDQVPAVWDRIKAQKQFPDCFLHCCHLDGAPQIAQGFSLL